MDIKVHGIIQRLDGAGKKVQVLISRDRPHEKELVDLDDDMTVNPASVNLGLRKKLGSAVDNIEIPRHIKPTDMARVKP